MILALENKIQHFMDISIKNAELQRDSVMEEYEKGLLSLFETHKKEATENALLQEKLEIEDLKRLAYKAYLKESLDIKRTLSLRQKQMAEQVFVEVSEMINSYKKSSEYEDLLLKQIKSTIEISGNEDVVIYVDSEDKHLLDSLSKKSGKDLCLSRYPFGGGTRAVIPSKNILIDNSFDSKIAEAKENFKLTF